jgi:predicted extracellular nuclease
LAFTLAQSCKTPKTIQDQNYKESEESVTFRVMFYNTENLFDIYDDPEKDDKEFLPGGNRGWDNFRYNDKLQKLAKVMVAIGGSQGNDLIGVCEIENRKVLGDLLKFTPLTQFGYEIIHKESPDNRGIDVGLLYKKATFTPIVYDFIPLKLHPDSAARSRDILYAKGVVAGVDTLHVFVNHWPSRRGGKDQSDNRRLLAAQLLRSYIDSIMETDIHCKIVIMGDFNDEPTDISLKTGLKAEDSTALEPGDLYNFMYIFKNRGEGSYKYQSEWNTLDQLIISYDLMDETSKMYTSFGSAHIFKTEWMLQEDTKFPGRKPFKTFQGPRYLGGYSDHLPVYLDIKVKR